MFQLFKYQLIKFTLIIPLGFIYSCDSQDPKQTTTINNPFNNIVFSDSLRRLPKLDTASVISVACFSPLYIGPSKDSIFLCYNTWDISQREFVRDAYRQIQTNDLSIYVDTTKKIASINSFNFIPSVPSSNNLENIDLSTSIPNDVIVAYPVFIKNLSSDTLSVGFGNFMPIIIQAIDSLGQWSPIQDYYFYDCGTGLSAFYIPPNQICVTSCKLFKGNFKTKMRLVYGYKKQIFSNEFYGWMDYKQFE
jgi:hypothetical protein